MKVDLHCHSKTSFDNGGEPEARIRQTIEEALGIDCFTQHHLIVALQWKFSSPE